MKNKSEKVQMTTQNEISSKEVKIGLDMISQTTVKKTLGLGTKMQVIFCSCRSFPSTEKDREGLKRAWCGQLNRNSAFTYLCVSTC